MSTEWSLLVIDLDGTFLAPDGTVSPANRSALDRVRDAGIDLIFATGRCRNETLHVLEVAEYDGPVIVAGGAMIVESVCGTTLDRLTMAPETVSDIVDHLHDEGHAALVLKDPHATGYDYLLVGGHELHPVSKWWMETFELNCRTVDAMHLDPDPEHTIRVGGIGAASIMEGVANRISAAVGDRIRMLNWPAVTASHLTGDAIHIVEMFAPAVDKWEMAVRYCERHDLDATRIVAIGDGLNDIGMLRSAALGIAMGNAASDIKSVADWTTASNADDGFAKAIDRLLEGGSAS